MPPRLGTLDLAKTIIALCEIRYNEGLCEDIFIPSDLDRIY